MDFILTVIGGAGAVYLLYFIVQLFSPDNNKNKPPSTRSVEGVDCEDVESRERKEEKIVFDVQGTSGGNENGARRQKIIQNSRRRLECGNPVRMNEEKLLIGIGNHMMSGYSSHLGDIGEFPDDIKKMLLNLDKEKYGWRTEFVRFYGYPCESTGKTNVGVTASLRIWEARKR